MGLPGEEGGGGGTVDSPLCIDESTSGVNNELNMLTRLLSSLFHLFASIVGCNPPIPDGEARSLQLAYRCRT